MGAIRTRMGYVFQTVATMKTFSHNLTKFSFKWNRRLGLFVLVLLLFGFLVLSQLRPICLWPYVLMGRLPALGASDDSDVTVVTAYFHLGHLEASGHSLGLYRYLRYAAPFSDIRNPLVVFTDSRQIENLILQARRDLANRTRVIRLQRQELRAFGEVETIRRLFSDPQYPKHYPNTVIPEYPCSQHAKYELVKRVLTDDLLPPTRYIAWVDIGYFRYLAGSRRKFYLVTPPDMDPAKVAMTQVKRPDWSLSPGDIFRDNLLWVGGGLSVATRSVYGTFVEEYEDATTTFLEQGLSNTDQQVIYSMFSPAYYRTHQVRTRIQTYSWMFDDIQKCWFYLGYFCYREVS